MAFRKQRAKKRMMKNLQVKKTLEDGLQLAGGVFIGGTFICPLIFPGLSFVEGLLGGFIAGVGVVTIYYAMASQCSKMYDQQALERGQPSDQKANC